VKRLGYKKQHHHGEGGKLNGSDTSQLVAKLVRTGHQMRGERERREKEEREGERGEQEREEREEREKIEEREHGEKPTNPERLFPLLRKPALGHCRVAHRNVPAHW
jgi:hypothetical protein